jgi:hypothetical protein
MMTHYRTCRHCILERKPCDRRAAVAASVKGLGLTSVGFRCAHKAPLFRNGQRVSVTWPVYSEDWRYEDGCSLESWPATVIQKTDKGFLILVDDVDSDHETPARSYIKNTNLFCNVRPWRLEGLDEPDRAICRHCGNPSSADGSVPGCDGLGPWGGRLPPLCLAQVDTHPKGGDCLQAPFMGSAVPGGDAP